MAEVKIPRRIIIRPLPKIVFLYPTLIVSIVCALVGHFGGTEWQLSTPQTSIVAEQGDSVPPTAAAQAPQEKGQVDTIKIPPRWLTNTFLFVFFLNLIIFAFEFPRTRGLMILFFVIAAVLAMVQFEVIKPIAHLFAELRPYANVQFYTTMSIFLAVIGVFLLIHTRFNYYEIEGNSILHHTGFMGRTKRYPTPNLRRSMEITDVFEYLLLRSGQYIFYPAQEREALVLDVVPGITRKDQQIELMMGTVMMDAVEEDNLDDSN